MSDLRSIFTHRRAEREIDEELEFHIEKRTRDNIEAGMTPAEARAEALRRFGDVSAVRSACHRIEKERVRAERRADMLDQLKQDTRFAFRSLLKRPGFAAVAIITLALGIGGGTAIFSVVDGVLLRPLPFADPDRLVLFSGVELGLKTGSSGTSYPDYVDIEESQSSFEEMAAWSFAQMAVTGSGVEPIRVNVARVSHDLFSVLGASPALGRGILPEEDRIGGDPVAVLSEGFWASRFASDPDVLGRTMTVNGVEQTIVGVMPAGFAFPQVVQFWIPMGPEHQEDFRGMHRLGVITRLKSRVTIDQATSDVVAIAARLEEEYPNSNTGRSARLQPLHEAVVANVRPALLMLLGAVGVVLLIVCGNVANLLLARGTSRDKEVAIRTALGARRFRLVRQMLTESLVLALAGGLIGVLVAFGGVKLLQALTPAGAIPRLGGIGIDERVLGFGLLVTLITGVLFGLFPALQASDPDLQTSLKEGGGGGGGGGGGRTSTSGAGRARLRQLLVVSEMALAVVLVAGAALLINSYWRLQQVDAGFDGENLLTLQLSLPAARYDDRVPVNQFYTDLLERVRALPGVRSAATGYLHPLAGGWETSFNLPGVFERPQGERPEARIRPITPGYFKTAGIPLLEGRAFSEHDDENTPGVVIINRSFARAFFPDRSPIGYTLEKSSWWPFQSGQWEIIGVVGDVKMDGLTASTPWAMYYAHRQMPFNDMQLFVRTSGDPLTLAGAIRNEVWAVDPELPVENIQTIEQIRAASVVQQRFQTRLLGIFATLAIVLAAVGIYGVLSYAVAQRTSEIGVRISLGAGSADVLRLVVGQGMKLAVFGLGLGLFGAFAVTRLISGLLFGVSPTDPLTFLAVAFVLTAVALAACTIPALRASRVDPVLALRAE